MNILNDDEVENLIESYNSETFWDELVDKFAMHDFFATYSEDKLEAMDEIEYGEKIAYFTKKYADEFEKNGLNNLHIKTNKYFTV